MLNLGDCFNYDVNKGFYIYSGGRHSGNCAKSIPCYLQYLFGGTCEYRFDTRLMEHHYLIKNDDIGVIDMVVTNECFCYENINTRLWRMCEEYDGYMRYKYRDYVREKE